MTYSWRKQGGQSHRQKGRVEKLDYPGPRYVLRWREAVPKWERDFCALVGQVPWPRLVEIKRWYQDEKVLQWKDSAVKEAFDKEKARYWTKINGQPCNTPLPDPDLFIDHEIDWNPSIDPQLLLEVEKELKIPGESWLEDIIPTGWGSTEELAKEQNQAKATDSPPVGPQVLDGFQAKPIIFPSGCGSMEEEQHPISGPTGWLKIEDIIPTGWGSIEEEQNKAKVSNGNDSWKQNTVPSDETTKENGWRNGKNGSWGPRKKELYGGAAPEIGNRKARGNNGGRGNWKNGGNGNYRRRWNGNSSSSCKCMPVWVPVKAED